MEEKKKKNIIDKIWDALSSIKFAIVVFALIGGTSMVGTVIEQGAEPAKNIKILSDIIGESLAPTVYSVLDSLGFMDMYHSWWFRLLLYAFSLNLVICSLDRFPAIWKAGPGTPPSGSMRYSLPAAPTNSSPCCFDANSTL